jgi:hypothetical protein
MWFIPNSTLENSNAEMELSIAFNKNPLLIAQQGIFYFISNVLPTCGGNYVAYEQPVCVPQFMHL